MRVQALLPGSHHIPTQPDWWRSLAAPDFQRIARSMDDAGYDSVLIPEHVVMPLWEVPRLGPHWLHCWTAMSFVAGATQRIRVDASVIVLPYHHPVELAKAVASLDVLSGGRVDLSIGVGHAEDEFAVLGQSFADRGPVTDETLEVVKLCWSTEEPVFHGRFFHVEGVAFAPRPVQKPRPPIYVGGNSKPALRRAARHEGWQPNPLTVTPESLRESLEYIAAQPEFAGKEGSFDVQWGVSGVTPGFARFGAASASELAGLRDQLVEKAGALAALGVRTTSFPVVPAASVDEYLDTLAWVGAEVLPATRAL